MSIIERPAEGFDAERWRIAIGWLVAALGGFVAIGTFFDHYALPLLALLGLLARPSLSRSARAAIATLGFALALIVLLVATCRDDGAGACAVARVVGRDSGCGCPWVFIGDTITHRLADARLRTTYVFPNLLAYATEQGATGIDEAADARRILANRPPVIVTSDRRLSIWNVDSLSTVKAALARDYVPVFNVRRGDYRTWVYRRRDLSRRASRSSRSTG